MTRLISRSLAVVSLSILGLADVVGTEPVPVEQAAAPSCVQACGPPSCLARNLFKCRPEPRYCRPEAVCGCLRSLCCRPTPWYCRPECVCTDSICRCRLEPMLCKPESVCCDPEPRCCDRACVPKHPSILKLW